MICPDCACDMVISTEAIVEEYKGEKISVDGIEHYICPECGEYAIGAKASKKLTRELTSEYARRQGLLTPDQIIAIRKKLKLNQGDFQKMLGVSGVTVSRWETGVAQQSKSADLLMREADLHACVALDLMKRAKVGASA